jgi:hypothetical protein
MSDAIERVSSILSFTAAPQVARAGRGHTLDDGCESAGRAVSASSQARRGLEQEHMSGLYGALASTF